MSHTLNKLKQSEIDHGLRKSSEIKPKYSQVLFIGVFVVILSCLLVTIKFRDVFFSEQQLSSSEKIIASSSKTIVAVSSEKKQIKSKVAKKIEVKKQDNSSGKKEKKDKEIEILKTNKVDLIDQQLAYFSNEPKIFDNVGYKNIAKVQRISKEELIKNLPKKNISSVENQPSPKQEKQPELWKDLSMSFKKSMPEMELNGITFFEKEEDRHIIINMNKYQLNDIVEKGPSIDEIRKDSVVMFYRNKQFILPLRM